MKNTAKASIRYGIQSKSVRFVLFLVVIQIFAVQAPNMQWQPFFNQHIPGQMVLGFVWMGIALSLMAGAWLAPRLLQKVADEKKVLVLCQVTIGVALVLAANIGFLPVTMLMFFIHEMARGSFGPIKDAYLHDNIPSKQRATIESFESLAHHGGGMIGLLLSGYLAHRTGISWTWTISGAALVVVTILIARNGKVKKPTMPEPMLAET